jgi:hypothetical protein
MEGWATLLTNTKGLQMAVYTFTNNAGQRFIYNTDRKITWAVIKPRGAFEVYGNKGGAMRAVNSAMYADKSALEVVPVTVATEAEKAEYIEQDNALTEWTRANLIHHLR